MYCQQKTIVPNLKNSRLGNVWSGMNLIYEKSDNHFKVSVKGASGGLQEFFFQKSTFWFFMIEETDIYQMLVVP